MILHVTKHRYFHAHVQKGYGKLFNYDITGVLRNDQLA